MRKKTSLILLLCAFLLGTVTLVSGQATGRNPFDLVPRMDAPPEVPGPDSAGPSAAATGNPFDLVAGTAAARGDQATVVRKKASRPPVSPVVQYNRLKLFITLAVLVLLALIVTVLRSLVNRSLMAFVNDNVMNQLYREMEGRGLLPFVLLYGLFFLNAGIFLFFLVKYSGAALPFTDLMLLLYLILGVSILFLLKHLLLNLLGFIFPIEKEMSRYSFTMIVFGSVIGLFLVPANIMMAYSSPEMLPSVVYASLGLIILIYLFRYLRGLMIANNFLLFHKFHFLLYICTIEIAPALLLLKLVLNQL